MIPAGMVERGERKRTAPEVSKADLAMSELLNFKPALRLEQVDDKRAKQMEDGKHRAE
jgi:hypothetical protein